MKFKCPRREIREASWFRIPTPSCAWDCIQLRRKLRSHVSNGHYWNNTIYTHWWVEREEDYIWLLIS